MTDENRDKKKTKKRFLFWGKDKKDDTTPQAHDDAQETPATEADAANPTEIDPTEPDLAGLDQAEFEQNQTNQTTTVLDHASDTQEPAAPDTTTDTSADIAQPDTDLPPSDPTQNPMPDPEPAPTNDAQQPPTKKKGFFQRLKDGLTKSSSKLSDGVTGIFTKRKLDDETLEELEDLLISSDLGVSTASKISTRLAAGRYNKEISADDVRAVLADEIVKVLEAVEQPFEIKSDHKPHIVLMVGVNGTGKTTTIGKLAAKAAQDGYKPMMAAGDTFRAAAIEQLKVWGERTGAPVVARDVGADSAGLAFDAIEQARAAGADVLFIDTAGRLQNKADLMAELQKVIRVVKKLDPSAPHDVLLVLDATTGQNAVTQVEAFRETAGVTGLVMTKLDGTARGGILVAIAEKFGLPVHAIGVGETVDDLQHFSARAFSDAIVGRDFVDPDTA